jgi:hypothetical protein
MKNSIQKTHPDNNTLQRLIPNKWLKYWHINADQHKGNEVQTGRTMFKILDIKPVENSREHENWVTITIEYDPRCINHLFTIFDNIGYRSGYNDARDVYDKKPKTNKTNETAY